jgi:CHAT domain-containing protein
MGLGNAYNSLGQYPKAIEYYQQSLAIKKEIGDRNGEAKSLGNLGNAYNSLGQYPKAIEFYQQSLAITKEIGDREAEGINLSNLGVSYEAQNQPGLAIVFYKQSVIVREGIRQDLRVLEKELQQSYTETVAGTYRNLADLLLSQDRIFEAQQVLELLKLQEIQDFTRSQRARGEMAKVVMLPQEQAIIDSYGKVVTFAAEIAKCEQTNCPQLSALRDQRDDLKRQYNQDVNTLETAIRQRTAQDDQFLLPTSFNQTADRIIQASDKYNSEPGTAVIYPLVLKDKLWLLWATEGKVIGKREITNVGRQKLNEEVLKLRLLLQKPDSDLAELQKSARQLYDWLIQPLEDELKAGKIHHLAFSLDRGFRYIPMAVLFDGQQYLIQKYTITTIISAQFTDTSDRLPANVNDTSILGVGASKAPGYDPLPHAKTEIDSIVRDNNSHASQGIYPGKKFLDGDFTFPNLRDNLKGRKLLHIATHGEFAPGNQYDSYLVLGDGEKLRIPDIEVLDDYLDGVHLVVLSACETALGDSFLTDPKQEEGIEINALSFYFLLDGAKTVMASLWRVDDTSTSLLMQRFYCTLANGNTTMTKAQALRKTQLSLLNNTPLNCKSSPSGNKDFTHPHYWAPFILIGNGL